MQSTIRRTNMMSDIAVFKAQITKHVENANELENNLHGVYRAFLSVNFSSYDLGEHKAAAPALMNAVFDLRQSLRKMIPKWHARSLMTRGVQSAAHEVLRVSRYAGDILGELWIDHERLDPDHKTMRAFTGTSHNTLTDPDFASSGNLPFRSGDVILARGRLQNSAAIARIGDIDSQFSHIAMVYIDANGKHWAVECLIEEGAHIVPLEQMLSHELSRAIVFRHRDENLAQRAAYVIHDRVRISRSPQGKKILYDFTMQIDDSHEMFCSELMHRAFRDASDGSINFPTFPTKLDMKNRDFADRIGVRALKTFGPGDVELEPDFDIVAEWQDYRTTADLRLQDIAMDRMFLWMDRDNYRFRETFLIKLISMFGRASTFMSESIQDMIFKVIPKIPPNMSRRAIAAIAMLNETGEELLESLRKHDDAAVRKTGLPMHPREVRKHLDEIHTLSDGEIGYLTSKKFERTH